MPDRYQVSSGEFERISPVRVGYYLESIIVNCTSSRVTVIDRSGLPIELTKQGSSAPTQAIEIILRSVNGAQESRNPRTSTKLTIPGIRILVPLDQIIQGPVYVKEADVVLCLTEEAHLQKHPKQAMVYGDMIRVMAAEMAQTDTMPVLRIFANDPQARLDKIYVYVADLILEIRVTHFEHEAATITFAATTNHNQLKRQVFSLMDLLDKDGGAAVDSGCIYYIATSLMKLELMIREGRQIAVNQMPEAKVEEIVKFRLIDYTKQITQLETTIKNLRTDTEQTKVDHEQTIRTLQQKLKALTDELERKTSEANHMKGIMDAQREQLLNDMKVRSEELRMKSTEEKTKQAVIATDIEEIKRSEIVWKVIGGTVIAVVTWASVKLFEKYATKST